MKHINENNNNIYEITLTRYLPTTELFLIEGDSVEEVRKEVTETLDQHGYEYSIDTITLHNQLKLSEYKVDSGTSDTEPTLQLVHPAPDKIQ